MTDDEVLAAVEHDDEYRLVSVLAKGEAGATELVMYGEQGPLVRKRITMALANEDAWRTLATIDDELLPDVVDIYELPDEFVVVYEYVEGEPLSQMMARRGVLLPHEAADIIVDVAAAAQCLHDHGIVHRDISPGNVIITPGGARLIDLGIARRHSDEATHDTTHLGTWGFAAPEQYGFAQTDARSDVWSMGRVLAFMLTGLAPGTEGFETRLADEEYVPNGLAEVIGWACAFEPSSRYSSAAEFARAVGEAVGKAGVVAPRPVTPEPAVPQPVASQPAQAQLQGRAVPGAPPSPMMPTGSVAEQVPRMTLSSVPAAAAPSASIGDVFRGMLAGIASGPWYEKVAHIVLGCVFLLMETLVVMLLREKLALGANATPSDHPVFGVFYGVVFFLAFVEIERALQARGRYANKTVPLRLMTLAASIAITVFVAIAVLFVVYLVLVLFGFIKI